MRTSKYTLFTSAIAKIACAHFAKGEIVQITYTYTDEKGTYWYNVTANESGSLPYPVAYPNNHLTGYSF